MRIEEKLWALALSEWYRRLGGFSHDVVSKAFDAIPRKHHEFMPGVGLAEELCEYHEKNSAHRVPTDHRIADSEPYSGDGAKQSAEIVKMLAGMKGMDKELEPEKKQEAKEGDMLAGKKGM